jgi:hypothetical protein
MSHPSLHLLAMHFLVDAPNPLRSMDFMCRTCGGFPSLDTRTGRWTRDAECKDIAHDQAYIRVYESSAVAGGPLAHDSTSSSL